MSAACEAANSTPEIGSSQPIASQLMNSSDLDYGDDDSARKKRRKKNSHRKERKDVQRSISF